MTEKAEQENLCNLFFELSNEVRLRILLKLEGNALRMTDLSKQLNLTVQETSRHLSRLTEKKLIQKDVEGFYTYTPSGEQVIRLIPGFDFVSQHLEHFTTHTYSCLPHSFNIRIGDLVNSDLTNDVMIAFNRVENRIRQADEFVWILSDQILMSSLKPLIEAMKRGARFKIMLPKNIVLPKGFSDHSTQQFFEQSTISHIMESRFLERIEVSIAMTEKEAAITFPTLDGRIDYGYGFVTTDRPGHAWCRDLFQHYWERADSEIPEYLLKI